MNNKEIAQLLREVAASYIIKNENRFKIVAYEKAADSIESLVQDLEQYYKEGKLTDVPGVGSGIASYLTELFTKGKVKHFAEIKKGLPKAMFSLMKLPGFGAKKSYNLAKTLRIKDDQDPYQILKKACSEHKIAKISGFGEKSEEQILLSLDAFKKKEAKLTRHLLHQAFEVANKVIGYLKSNVLVIQAYPLGSLRRMMATVGDIDIAVSSNQAKNVIDYFTQYPDIKRVIDKGELTSTILLKNNMQVDLMIEPVESFGALLQHFTGSKQHNIKLREFALRQGMSLSEHGVRIKNHESRIKQFANEEDFYKYLQLDWIPPELREDRGEIQAAKNHTLPDLVELKDIKGDLHLHSSFNIEPSHDLGENSFEEIVNKARSLNYEYISFSEHNPSQSKHNSEQIIKILTRRKSIIDKLNYSTKSIRVHCFNMLEVDILPDGQIALPDKALALFDGIIVSIHSSFQQDKDSMTKRILKALSFPKVKILGHPTGRLLEKRESINADWDKIFAFCLYKNIALEINASPYRLDLPDPLIYEAVKKNIRLIINTDAHRISEMDLMSYGVVTARRGWAEKKDILNTLPYQDFSKWLLS